MKIKEIKSREILDSRGNPTVETAVYLSDGSLGVASVPAGASKGRYEVKELRDGGKRYFGLGVKKAVSNVNKEISRAIKGKEFDQKSLDQFIIKLDGTPDKSNLGANTILSVSLAFAKAAANSQNVSLYQYIQTQIQNSKFKIQNSLPIPMFNILNGGAHADNNIDFQEFMIIPKLESFFSNLEAGSEIHHSLKEILKSKGLPTGVGDEGGFAPNLDSNSQALDFLQEAILKAGYKLGKEVFFGLDAAASALFKKENQGCYLLNLEKVCLKNNQLVSLYQEWVAKYPLISIEDGLGENDWEGWELLTQRLGLKMMIIGDDLFTTNPERLKKGIQKKAANSVLIKPNQIGTLTETLETIKMAKENNFKIIVSHRSGETTDSFIADLAVGVKADYIKAGAPCHGERLAKYNRLLEIEKEISETKDCKKFLKVLN